jgi:3-hydroxybutyryl-CoA dehydrogenase
LTTVAIIGAGPLGRWLALSAARAGFRVLLEDVMPANLHHAQEMLRRELGPEYFAEQLGGASRAGDGVGSGAKAQSHFDGRMRGMNPPPPSAETAGPSAPSAAADFAQDDEQGGGADLAQDSSQGGAADLAQDDMAIGVAFVSTIEGAVREADLVIDCVPDELESKLEILWLLDRMAPPRTVLATPTTRLSIADLANCTYRPDKCVAIVAEAQSLAAGLSGEILLRTTSRTTAETLTLVGEFWRRLGVAVAVEIDSG